MRPPTPRSRVEGLGAASQLWRARHLTITRLTGGPYGRFRRRGWARGRVSLEAGAFARAREGLASGELTRGRCGERREGATEMLQLLAAVLPCRAVVCARARSAAREALRRTSARQIPAAVGAGGGRVGGYGHGHARPRARSHARSSGSDWARFRKSSTANASGVGVSNSGASRIGAR